MNIPADLRGITSARTWVLGPMPGPAGRGAPVIDAADGTFAISAGAPDRRISLPARKPAPATAAERKFIQKFGRETGVTFSDDNKVNTAAGSRLLLEAQTDAVAQTRRRQEADFTAFCTVYGTSGKASQVINAAMRRQHGYSFDTSGVIDTIRTRYDERFKIDSMQRAQLKNFCKNVAHADLVKINDYIDYKGNLNKTIVRMFRGQDMTIQGFTSLKALFERKIPINPTHFFSCTSHYIKAREFWGCPQGSDNVPIVFDIHGYSSTGLRSLCSDRSEAESLFSTHATFEIVQIEEGRPNRVSLREIAPVALSRPLPY